MVMGKDNKLSREIRAKIMGIVNLTEDSYFAASRVPDPSDALRRIEQMLAEGADMIDLGACSTRPGSTPVDEKTEWLRLQPVLRQIRDHRPGLCCSIDTFRSNIVERAYDEIGPFWVNDISAGEEDRNMLKCVSRLELPYIAMHKRGTPQSMQELCHYDDLIQELIHYFQEFDIRSQYAGIARWILDPGFGFAKTIEQNLELLDRLDELMVLQREVLIGISRKSFLYKPLGLGPEDVLEQTGNYHRIALKKGVSMLRVHDVAPAKEIIHQLNINK